jgi:hypothetical protein
MKIKIVIVAALCLGGLYSCQKELSNSDTTKVDASLLIGSWTLLSVVQTPALFDFNGDGVNDADAVPYLQDCKKDDFTTFLADSTHQQDEGATRCDPSDPQIIPLGPWSLSADKTVVIAGGYETKIIQLDKTTLVTSYTVDLGGLKFSNVAKYKRK